MRLITNYSLKFCTTFFAMTDFVGKSNFNSELPTFNLLKNCILTLGVGNSISSFNRELFNS